ncbi:MAG: hypothetical protein LLF76_14040 [Planctomycetaceae bacterium]|nr:hypothetical protein [Planctomycetaceae bacterium]
MNISLKPVSVFLKKYAALLPSAGIIAASLLLFVPIYLIGGSVKKSMASSASLARQVQSELSDVPGKNKAEQVKLYMDKLQEDAEQVENLALQSCRRDLITYVDVIFPKPLDSSAQVFHEFGRKYRLAIEEMLKSLNALDAPSDNEIRARTGINTYATALGGRGNVSSAVDPRIDGLCLSRAQEISVYGHPKAFQWYDFWENYKFAGEEQAMQDCWDSQAAFWIYQDVAETIEKMNGSRSTVSDSPVKRLLGVSFTGPVVVAGGDNQLYGEVMFDRQVAGRDIPNYVTTKLASNFLAVSPTGRIGNEDLDIVHFAVSVVVDNRSVVAFLKELCSEKTHSFHTDFTAAGEEVKARHNQISILQSDVKAIDPASPEHRLYRYGKSAAMQVDLVCEYQFYRKSYDALKPKPIQDRLDQTAAAETPGMTAPMP